MPDSPVVLLHAFPLASALFTPQAVAFARAGGRLVTPDQRGFAAGAPDPGPYTLDDAADDVARFLDAEGIERAWVGGVSMGGYVALRFLARHGPRLAGLILSDTKATPDTDEAKKNRAALAAKVRAEGAAAAVAANLPKLLGKTTHETRPEVAGFVRALGESRPRDGVARALEAMAARPDSTPDLARARVPVLVVVGEEDVITPLADAEAMIRAAPGATLRTIPRAGHLASLEDPDAWNAAVLASVLG